MIKKICNFTFVICIIVKYQQKTIKNMSDENIDKERDSKEKKYSTTKMVLGIIMIAIYLGMAYALLFTKFFEVTIQYEWMRYVFGTVFAVYGIWRGYRQFANMN